MGIITAAYPVKIATEVRTTADVAESPEGKAFDRSHARKSTHLGAIVCGCGRSLPEDIFPITTISRVMHVLIPTHKVSATGAKIAMRMNTIGAPNRENPVAGRKNSPSSTLDVFLQHIIGSNALNLQKEALHPLHAEGPDPHSNWCKLVFPAST